jgi:hypothetical protein
MEKRVKHVSVVPVQLSRYRLHNYHLQLVSISPPICKTLIKKIAIHYRNRNRFRNRGRDYHRCRGRYRNRNRRTEGGIWTAKPDVSRTLIAYVGRPIVTVREDQPQYTVGIDPDPDSDPDTDGNREQTDRQQPAQAAAKPRLSQTMKKCPNTVVGSAHPTRPPLPRQYYTGMNFR